MPIYLRQSTASQEIPLGYFVDSTDGNTSETGLTIANTDIRVWKNGATTLANKNSGGATHISNGIYYTVLDATDTNTLGSLVIFVKVAGALAIRVECVVLTANVYDSLIAGSDLLGVDAREISSSTGAADNVEANIGNLDATISSRSTAAALATVDSNVDDILTDTGITIPAQISGLNDVSSGDVQTAAAAALTAYDPPTNAEMVARTLAAADYFDPVTDVVAQVTLVDTVTTNTDMRGTDNAATAAALATVDSNVDDILEDTATTIPGLIGDLNDLDSSAVQTAAAAALTAYDPPTNAEMVARTLASADYGTATNQTTILARLGAFTGTGVNTVLGFLRAMLRSDLSAPSDVGGTYDPATDSAEALRNRGDAAWITATGFSAHSAADVADAVWDEAAASHVGAGSFGAEVQTHALSSEVGAVVTAIDALNDLSATEVEDAVWDATLASHLDSGSTGAGLNAAGSAGDPWSTTLPGAYGANTAGNILGNNLDAAVSSRSTLTAQNVWEYATRILTAGTNIVLSKGTGLLGLNDLSAAQVNAEVDTALTDYDAPTKAELDALETHGDSTWATATGFSTHNAADVADAVWDETLSGHLGAGSTGSALNGASSAGDPWGTELPGAYGAGTAGNIVGNNLDAQVSSRSSHDAADVWSVGSRTLTSFGTLIADIWSHATRVLTSGTNIVLAKGTGVTGLNDLSAAQVNAEVDTALADYDGPTNADLEARTLPTAEYATALAVSAVDDVIAAILEDTGTTLPAAIAALNDLDSTQVQAAAAAALAAYDPPTNAEMVARTLATASYATAAGVAAVQADTDNIQTRLPAALVGGRMDANTSAINSSAMASVLLALSAGTMVNGTTVAGTLSTTQVTTNLTNATNDAYNGRMLYWTSGNLVGQATEISDYDGVTKLLTFVAVTGAPSVGDTFIIV